MRAQRIADRFPGVSPMDVLRSTDFEWVTWLALARSHDADIEERRAQANAQRR